jgi:hypothetical protein
VAKVPEVGFIPRFQPIPNRLSRISREVRGAHGGFASVEEKALTKLAHVTVGQGRGGVTTQRLPDRARMSGVRGDVEPSTWSNKPCGPTSQRRWASQAHAYEDGQWGPSVSAVIGPNALFLFFSFLILFFLFFSGFFFSNFKIQI